LIREAGLDVLAPGRSSNSPFVLPSPAIALFASF
jgi:hypothetical protein